MKRISISLLIITILIVSLACNLPALGEKRTPISTPIAQKPLDPQQVLSQAVKVDPVNNTITVTLTEAEMDGIILTELQKLETSSQVSVTNPVVKLRNGLVTLTGQMVSGPMNFDFSLSLKPTVTSDHKLVFSVVESNFGALPVPAQIINQVVDRVNESINQSINSSGENISVDSITIADGTMVIVAHR
jgi:uncharacterized protein YpmS